MHSVVARRLMMMSLYRSRARVEINLSQQCGCKLLCVLLRRTSLMLHGEQRGIYTTGRCAQTKRHCVPRRKESIAMME